MKPWASQLPTAKSWTRILYIEPNRFLQLAEIDPQVACAPEGTETVLYIDFPEVPDDFSVIPEFGPASVGNAFFQTYRKLQIFT